MNIFIDIETFGHQPSIEDIKAPSNYKNEETIQKYKEEHLEEQWRKNSLNKFACDVVCISAYAPEDDSWFCMASENERELLTHFDTWLHKFGHRPLSAKWIGAYVGEFDIPMLRIRAIKYNLNRLKQCLPHVKFSERYVDILASFLGTAYKDTVSLKTLLKFYDVKGKTDGLSGGDVFDLWRAKEYAKIAEYCKGDVEAVVELYKLL